MASTATAGRGWGCVTEVPGSTEVAHNALGASIYRFSNDGLHFEAEIVDPQKLA